jgi:hypothetical protein
VNGALRNQLCPRHFRPHRDIGVGGSDAADQLDHGRIRADSEIMFGIAAGAVRFRLGCWLLRIGAPSAIWADNCENDARYPRILMTKSARAVSSA